MKVNLQYLRRFLRPGWRVPILLGIFIVILGGIELRHFIQNDRLLDRVEELGGDFYSDHRRPISYLTSYTASRQAHQLHQKLKNVITPPIDRWCGIGWVGRFKNITGVDYRNTKVRDEDLKYLRGQKYISWMWLTDTEITDAGLAHLSDLPLDYYLQLDGSKITSDGLAHLSRMDRLKVLDLKDTAVGDQGLIHLYGLSNLESIYLGRTNVTKAGARELKKRLPKCRVSHF